MKCDTQIIPIFNQKNDLLASACKLNIPTIVYHSNANSCILIDVTVQSSSLRKVQIYTFFKVIDSSEK